MPNPSELQRQAEEAADARQGVEIDRRPLAPDYIRSIPDSSLTEAITALAGAIEVLGDVANLSHAKRLLEEARNNA